MSNLPSKFTPELWDGWSKCQCPARDCESIVRECKAGPIGVVPQSGKFIALSKNTTHFSSPLTESEALKWANGCADRLGGWV